MFILKRLKMWILSGAILFFLSVYYPPQSDKLWAEDHETLAEIEINGDEIYIENVRDFSYILKMKEDYYNESYNLNSLEEVNYILTHFKNPAFAHAFLSFNFGNKKLIISVEARREENEEFSILKGAFRGYELIFVLSSEEDSLGRRIFTDKDETYFYTLDLTEKEKKDLFLGFMEFGKDLEKNPQWYNTLTSSSTILFFDILNKNRERDEKIFKGFEVFLPAYSAKYFYENEILKENPKNINSLNKCLNDVYENSENLNNFSNNLRVCASKS